MERQIQEFLEALVDSVRYTLKVTASTEVHAGQPRPRMEAPPHPALAAIIGIVGAPFMGSVILGFQKDAFLAIMSRMLGGHYSEINADIQDGAAELLNISLGQAKSLLNKRGFNLQQAIPTVVYGQQMRLAPPSGKASVIIPFTCDVGEFYVELTTGMPDSGKGQA